MTPDKNAFNRALQIQILFADMLLMAMLCMKSELGQEIEEKSNYASMGIRIDFKKLELFDYLFYHWIYLPLYQYIPELYI